jgi:hypothetical protein
MFTAPHPRFRARLAFAWFTSAWRMAMEATAKKWVRSRKYLWLAPINFTERLVNQGGGLEGVT